jgi:two-component system OmpR family response regulator
MAHILLIEDDNLLRQAIVELFEGRLYQITANANGNDGLKLALHNDFDLIILDLMLPKLSGFLITKQLRAVGKETPILIISSKNQLSDLMTAFNFGADGYLYKPFNLNELLCRADALIKRPTHSLPTKISLGSLTYDAAQCSITCQGKSLDLQKRQLKILYYLMSNPDRIISKTELIDKVWEYDADILPSTIDVHISRLRKALNAVKSGPKLECFHGFGIKLANLF